MATVPTALPHIGCEEMTMISRGLLESAPDPIIVSGPDGRILLVHSQVEHRFGYGREELVGWPVDILLPERLSALIGSERRATLAEGGGHDDTQAYPGH